MTRLQNAQRTESRFQGSAFSALALSPRVGGLMRFRGNKPAHTPGKLERVNTTAISVV